MKRAILLADDSPTIQRLVERTFEGSEFTVEAVSNGEAAVQKLEELAPAAVLADIYMPGKNGYEVCAFVKQHAALSETPVVLLVGAFEVFDEEEAGRVGADTWITKPFEPKQLTETVSGLALAGVSVAEAQGVEVHADAAADSLAASGPAASARPDPGVHRGTEQEEAENQPEAGDGVGGDAGGPDLDRDLLGLKELFPPAPADQSRRALSEEEVEAIADRVIDRLSAEVVESIAWDIVPEIADRVMRDGLKQKD